MPLAELVHYLNRQNRAAYGPALCPGDGLSVGPAGIVGHDEGLRLHSVFQPISAVRSDRIAGHEALLRAADGDGRAFAVADVFRRAQSPEKLVYLDRLCRTLHVLNYLQLTRRGGGTLFLNVEPRHVRAVAGDHGLVFETIVKRCGLAPEHIVLQLRAGELPGGGGGAPLAESVGAQLGESATEPADEPDLAELADKLSAYRTRGYRVAIDQAGPGIDGRLLAVLRPELVKFDLRRFAGGGETDTATAAGTTAAATAARACRAVGAEVAATHVSASRHLALVRALTADYWQGHYLAPPTPGLGDPAPTARPAAAGLAAIGA